jgi:hypothetical protein
VCACMSIHKHIMLQREKARARRFVASEAAKKATLDEINQRREVIEEKHREGEAKRECV